MLKRKYRLPKKFLIKAKSYNFKGFILKVSENNKEISRFAFIVSKRVDKRATQRNKIKRVLRRMVEERIAKIRPGLDFLLIAKGLPDEKTLREAKELFERFYK